MRRTISAEELKKKMEEVAGCVIVNVLGASYYKDCHITGSINVPLDELKARSQEWHKTKDIVVYCAHSECPASAQAYDLLAKLGFERIAAYEGGIKEWKKKGLPTQGACALEYLK